MKHSGSLLMAMSLLLYLNPLGAQETPPPNTPAPEVPARPDVETTLHVPPPALNEIKRIFVEPMANELDQFIRAEITKQFKGTLTVVLKKEDADATLTGTGEWQKGTGAAVTGRWLGLHDTATGAVSLVSKDGKTVLWASEAGDRSIWWGVMKRGGPRKVADRLMHNLRKAMGRR
jgi:hypothetical protein